MLWVLTLDNKEEWDRLVRRFRKHDSYYLSGYVKSFQIHGDGEPLLLYYEGKGKDDGVRGINVVMKRDVATAPKLAGKIGSGRYYDLTTPYGYGGWLIERPDDTSEDITSQLFTDYCRWCERENIISEFVRFHPMLCNQVESEKEYIVIPLGETVAIDLSSPEVIWANITSKNRNVIRKGIKNDVKIYQGRNPELYDTFRSIYNATMDKDDADPYYYFESEFYESVLNDLDSNAQIFYAQIPDGTVIAASIMLGCNGYLNYHLSGYVREYSSLAATNLILYKTALWGCENGYRSLYLGGGVGSGEDSLFKFKRAFFKGGLHRFYIGKKVINTRKYDELCRIGGVENHSDDIEKSGYFPEYRSKD